MTTLNRVATADSPQGALLALASALDYLIERIAELETPKSTWGEWGTGELNVDPARAARIVNETNSANQAAFGRIEKLRERMKDLSGDDLTAAQAELKLAKDELVYREPPVDRDLNRTVQHVNDDGVIVDLPPADSETVKDRRRVAEAIGLHDDYPEEVVESFVKGGPLVIYYTDRDYVMGLSDAIKRWIVGDVMKNSPAEAEEVARDLLKDLDPAANRQIQEETSARTIR